MTLDEDIGFDLVLAHSGSVFKHRPLTGGSKRSHDRRMELREVQDKSRAERRESRRIVIASRIARRQN